MNHRVPTIARRFPARTPVALLVVLLATACGFAGAQAASAPPAAAQSPSGQASSDQASSSSPASNQAPSNSSNPASSNQARSQDEGSPSSQGHHKGSSAHHVQVAEEIAPPPELAQAETFIQKHDYAAAEPLLRKVVTADPSNYAAWFDLGFAENGIGKVDDSIAAYRKSVAAKPDVFESNLNLGLQLAKTGQPDAEQFLRAATQLKPTTHIAEGQSRAWLSLGHVLEAMKPEEAILAYRQAAILQPKDAEPHLSAGMLLEKDGKTSEAVEEYKQALALDPSSDAITALANIYMRGRHLPEAEEYLRKLVALHPEDAGAHIQLGRVLAAEGKNDAAIAELQDGAKLDPTDASVQRDLADLYSATGKNDQAEAAYRALITQHRDADPAKDAELHRSLGQTLLREKKFPDAQQELLIAVKLKPDLGEAYGDLAFAASENKNYPLTIKALDARAQSLPEVPTTYFLRASAYDHLKDFKRAAVNYHLFLNTANGKYPDQEWQAKHRLIAIEPKK
jgi:tetratricopeptide (TPR) repeat protein